MEDNHGPGRGPGTPGKRKAPHLGGRAQKMSRAREALRLDNLADDLSDDGSFVEDDGDDA